MEAVLNGNMLSARKYFLCVCTNEAGYNWKCDEPPLGGDSYPELAWPVKQAGLYITTLYTV